MPKKILLADDSITIQKVVELTFSEGDYQVFSVGNGTQALKRISEVRPDVALLDVIMPEANGYEVCEKVKQNPETSWIPVLLLTGTFEPFDRKRAEAAGADGHLTKPFESQMLISKVEELIASSQHPVIEAGRLGKMEIVSEGTTRVAVEEAPPADLPVAEREEAPELTSQGIVPDRFDDLGEPAASGPPQGLQTVRISADRIFTSPAASPREEIPPAVVPEVPPEAWDELASDLGTAGGPEALRGAPPAPAPSAMPEPERADTLAPFPGPRDSSEPTVAEAVSSGTLPGVLSAADVDRVAAAVVEKLSDKVLREIAWEVIPELAESLIKQRIRELEEKISREG